MQCDYFDAGVCRSCTWMNVPYTDQLITKQSQAQDALDEAIRALGADPATVWGPPVTGPEENFRNKAKMVVTGTTDHPKLGILDQDQHPKYHDGTGVDLRNCGLYEPGLRTAFPLIAEAITAARLTPYSLGTRDGELKHVLITLSPDAALMIRFVFRSTDQVPKLRCYLEETERTGTGLIPRLAEAGVPARVITANILPEHQALTEGEQEIHLYGDETLVMRLNDVPLNLRPQGFFQTNTGIAADLYDLAAEWVAELDPAPQSVWDLYAGVGGFGFTLARQLQSTNPHATVWGVETSTEAIAAAQHTTAQLGLEDTVSFIADDATAIAQENTESSFASPDTVVVNPPRRGIGAELATWLNDHAAANGGSIRTVLYSSCNPKTLAKDLASMSDFVPVKARMLDMFPQTPHSEVLMLLTAR